MARTRTDGSKGKGNGMTRRAFLKLGGIGTAGATALAVAGRAAAATSKGDEQGEAQLAKIDEEFQAAVRKPRFL